MQKLFELGPGDLGVEGDNGDNITQEQYEELRKMMVDKGRFVFIKDGWIWYTDQISEVPPDTE